MVVILRPDAAPIVTTNLPTTRPFSLVMTGPSRTLGVRFHPYASAVAFDAPVRSLRPDGRASAIRDAACIDTSAAIPAEALPRAVFQEWLHHRLGTTARIDAVARQVVSEIIERDGASPVGDLAACVGLGTRQLQRRFVNAVGLTPKEFSRIRRMRAALQAALDGARGWAAIAGSLGFADQPHLVRDLAQLTGLTPREIAEHLSAIQHIDVVA